MTSQSDPEDGPAEGITDDQLPPDLRPGEDNPLAEPLADGEEIEGTAPDVDAGPDPQAG